MFFRKPIRIEGEPELEDLQADVLKRLAQLTDDATKAQNERFALVLDTLEARIHDLNGLVVALGSAINANREELSRRIDRVAATTGELQLRENVEDNILGFKVASEQPRNEAHEAKQRAEAAIALMVRGGAQSRANAMQEASDDATQASEAGQSQAAE